MDRTQVTIHTGDTLATILEQLEAWASRAGKCSNINVTIHAIAESEKENN